MQHKEEPRWLRAPANLNLPTPFLRGDPVRVIGDSLEFLAHTENGKIIITTPLHETFEMSHDALYADMCEMSILNEP